MRALALLLLLAAACHPAPPTTRATAAAPAQPPPHSPSPSPAPTPAQPSSSLSGVAAPPTRRDLAAELGSGRALYACIERELASRPALEGRLVADVDVAADGRILAVDIPESTFPDDTSLRVCVVEAWRRMRIPPPPAGRTIVRPDLVWQASPSCPGPPRDAAPVASGVAARGSLGKEMIRRVIRTHLLEVRTCYEQQLVRTPTLQGRIMVQFMIAPTGFVGGSVVESSTIDDPAVGECIAATVRGWRFPRPCGGGVVIVSYPFVLKVAP